MLKKSLFVFLFFICGNSFCNQLEPVDHLKNIVTEFVQKTIMLTQGETLSVEVIGAAESFQYPKCNQEIQAKLPKDSNPEQISAVELTCQDDKGWHTFIPVRVQVNTLALVARHPIPARELISESDIEFIPVDRNQLYRGYFKTTQEVIGQQAISMIPAGTVLTKQNTESPLLVRRNAPVELIYANNYIQVTMKGVAHTDGRANQIIKAYNPSSKQTIDAIVIGENKAKVIS